MKVREADLRGQFRVGDINLDNVMSFDEFSELVEALTSRPSGEDVVRLYREGVALQATLPKGEETLSEKAFCRILVDYEDEQAARGSVGTTTGKAADGANGANGGEGGGEWTPADSMPTAGGAAEGSAGGSAEGAVAAAGEELLPRRFWSPVGGGGGSWDAEVGCVGAAGHAP